MVLFTLSIPLANLSTRCLISDLVIIVVGVCLIASGTNNANWNAWDSTYSSSDFAYRYLSDPGDEVGFPQPMLSDIEFDETGNMILGLRDRFGDQFGQMQLNPNGANDGTGANGGLYRADGIGDILRATPNGANWSLSQTEATNGSEFFPGDNYTESGVAHDETSNGGLVILPGSTQVATTTMDPINNRASGWWR